MKCKTVFDINNFIEKQVAYTHIKNYLDNCNLNDIYKTTIDSQTWDIRAALPSVNSILDHIGFGGDTDEDDLKYYIINNLAYYEWHTTKVTYNVSEGLSNELKLMSTDFKIHKDDLQHIPHDAFYVDLRNAHFRGIPGAFISFHHFDNIFLVLISIWYTEEEALASYYNFGRIEDDYLHVVNIEDDVVYDDSDESHCITVTKDECQEQSLQVSKFLFNLLNYIISEESDIENNKSQTYKPQSHKSSKTNKTRQTPTTPASYNVGFRIGPQLFAERKRYEELCRHAGTGQRLRPHLRKAHWHRYWVGSDDNKHLTLKWVKPIYVNCDTPEMIDIVERGVKRNKDTNL